jgi:hypothetical protein
MTSTDPLPVTRGRVVSEAIVIGLVVATLPALALPAATASNDTVTIQVIQTPAGSADASPYAG